MSPTTSVTLEGDEIAAQAPSGGGAVSDYFALLKPRVMSLVVFTSVVGLVCAPGEIHWVLGMLAVICVAIGAGASGALNMWFESDIDAQMNRTRGRPIPAGKLDRGEALAIGVVLSVGSVVVMGLFVNLVAAALLAATIVFYSVVYTVWLKRRTPQNIVIGGAAGAFPPVIGWAAVTGDVTIEPLILFTIIFFWTPPHFWALALFQQEDYRRAGVPMLPIVAGDEETRRHILIYSIVLAPLALTPVAIGMAGWIYGTAAVALGLIFVALAWRLLFRADVKSARDLFAFSILYLFVLFACLLVEQMAVSI